MTTYRDPRAALVQGDVVTFFLPDGSSRAGVVVSAGDAWVQVQWYDVRARDWVTDSLPARRCHRHDGTPPPAGRMAG
jgi:hypothetical protein